MHSCPDGFRGRHAYDAPRGLFRPARKYALPSMPNSRGSSGTHRTQLVDHLHCLADAAGIQHLLGPRQPPAKLTMNSFLRDWMGSSHTRFRSSRPLAKAIRASSVRPSVRYARPRIRRRGITLVSTHGLEDRQRLGGAALEHQCPCDPHCRVDGLAAQSLYAPERTHGLLKSALLDQPAALPQPCGDILLIELQRPAHARQRGGVLAASAQQHCPEIGPRKLRIVEVRCLLVRLQCSFHEAIDLVGHRESPARFSRRQIRLRRGKQVCQEQRDVGIDPF